MVMLAVFWVYLFATFQLELAMFFRFVGRFAGYGVLLLSFLTWWLTNRRISRRDRFLAVGMMILFWLVAWRLADKSVDAFALFMVGFPMVFTAWVAWLEVSRNRSLKVQRLGMCAVTAIIFGSLTLFRFDGLDGRQHMQLSWRWSPPPEELFLADKQRTAATGEIAAPTGSSREWTLQAGDWPEFRGSQRDGIVRGVKVTLGSKAPQQLWRERVGPAWSSMIVVDGFLVTQEQRGPSVAIVCYDAATGKEVWAHENPARFTEGLSGAGPRATPTFHAGRIYALGGTGKLSCLAASTGQPLWERDVVADAGADVPQWGFSGSPLVVDGLVIAFAGGAHQKGLLAYRADTGDLAWTRDAGKLSYSSPQISFLGGKRLLLMHDNKTLAGLNIADGSLLWDRSNGNEMAMPMLQPHVLDASTMLVPAEPGIALLQLTREKDKWNQNVRWASNRLKPSFNDYVVHDGHIYGLDDGILCCLDLETGRRLWKDGRYGFGQMLLLPDQGALLVLSEKGEVILVAANPEHLQELGRFQAITGKTWNHPILAHGRLYVRNGEEMACYELQQAEVR